MVSSSCTMDREKEMLYRFVNRVKKGDLETVRLMLQHDRGVLSKTVQGKHPLYWAASYGHREMVTELLARGAAVNARSEGGRTALGAAALGGHVQTVAALLARGGSKQSDNSGYTPLMSAALSGHLAVVELLLGTGQREVDRKDTVTGDTALSGACQEGHVQVVRRLLLAGARQEIANKQGTYPIHIAAQYNRVEVVGELLEAGWDIDRVSRDRIAGHRAGNTLLYNSSPSLQTRKIPDWWGVSYFFILEINQRVLKNGKNCA